jgi:hypothetical protein
MEGAVVSNAIGSASPQERAASMSASLLKEASATGTRPRCAPGLRRLTTYSEMETNV